MPRVFYRHGAAALLLLLPLPAVLGGFHGEVQFSSVQSLRAVLLSALWALRPLWQVGHVFFWSLKAEMHVPEVSRTYFNTHVPHLP